MGLTSKRLKYFKINNLYGLLIDGIERVPPVYKNKIEALEEAFEHEEMFRKDKTMIKYSLLSEKEFETLKYFLTKH